MDLLLILDCNYLCHRSKHVFGSLSDQGSATGVVYGFLTALITLQSKFNTNRFVFAWDSQTLKRKEAYPKYKENRNAKEMTKEELEFEREFRRQMSSLQNEYLHTIGFRNIFSQEGYESDDIIASVCMNLPKEQEAIIVSADEDLFQCITDHISCYNPRTAKLMYKNLFEKTYGIQPDQWYLVKAIGGCKSDNIEGITSIGQKTALRYLTATLNPTSKSYMAIVLNESIILRNKDLVQLPYPGVKTFKLQKDNISQEGWNAVTKKLGMKSIRYCAPL